ncbi:MAG TPA: hypothetical protein VGM08_02705 [Candidatus Saccharimonadales bacterium]|jgi:energy-coupling factor transporter ATP-binding protein EcfA2
MKLLITGNSGSGKSTLLPALEARGFKTYNTDDIAAVCRLEDRVSGEVVDWPNGFVDWTKYAWRWQAAPLRRLLDSATDVAVAAIMENQYEFYDWFDWRFVIIISDEALARHWQHSSDHHAGAHPGNLERALSRNKLKEQQFLDDGCIPIAGDRPIEEMSADITRIIHEHIPVAK